MAINSCHQFSASFDLNFVRDSKVRSQMLRARILRFAIMALVTFFLFGMQNDVAIAAAITAPPSSCGSGNSGTLLTATMSPNGAVWSMCIIPDVNSGFYLTQVTLSPPSRDGGSLTSVLNDARLSQIILSPSSGASSQAIPSVSWSSPNAATCYVQNLFVCIEPVRRGYAWRGNGGLLQGESLVLSVIGKSGTDTFLQKWTFNEDGSIQTNLGVYSTSSSSFGRVVTGLWRTDFGNLSPSLSPSTVSVEQLEYSLAKSSDPISVCTEPTYSFPLPTATPCGTNNFRYQVAKLMGPGYATLSPDSQRFWRVKRMGPNNNNGWPISFELLLHQTVANHPDILFDIAFTSSAGDPPCYVRNLNNGGCLISELRQTPANSTSSDLLSSGVVGWIVTSTKQVGAIKSWYGQSFEVRPRDVTTTSPLL